MNFLARNWKSVVLASVLVGTGVYLSTLSTTGPEKSTAPAKLKEKRRKSKKKSAKSASKEIIVGKLKRTDISDADRVDDDSKDGSKEGIVNGDDAHGIDPEVQSEIERVRGNALFSEKKWSEAIEAYSKALEYKEKAAFYSNRSACYIHLEQFEDAIEDCTAAIVLEPKYKKAFNRRAQALERKGEKIGALRDLTVVAILENFSEASMLATDRLLKNIATELAPEILQNRVPAIPSAIFVSAFLESYQRTRCDLENIMRMEATAEHDSVLLAAIEYLIAKDFTNAFTTLQDIQSLNMSPEFKVIGLNLVATFYYLSARGDETLALLNEALALYPQDVDSNIKKSIVLMEKGKVEECIALFEQIENQSSEHPDLYYHRGQVKFIANQFDAAIADYRRVLKLDDEFMYAHIQLGVALYKSGATGESEKVFRKATTKFPNRAEVYHYHGEIYADKGDTDMAMKLFEQASQVDPNSPLPYINMALISLQFKNDPVTAEVQLKKAIEVDPICDIAFSHLGQILLAQNKTDEAIGVYERAIKLAKNETELIALLTYCEAAKAQKFVMETYPHLVLGLQL